LVGNVVTIDKQQQLKDKSPQVFHKNPNEKIYIDDMVSTITAKQSLINANNDFESF
jgi:hypothetical protein